MIDFYTAGTPNGQKVAIMLELIYLAEKSGRLLPSEPSARIAVLQWLMFQMAGVGPMFGQAGYWRRANPPSPQAIERYTTEANRLLGVLDRRLAATAYLSGADYTIADVATWPWVNALRFIGLDLAPYPDVGRWVAAIKSRPAVERGLAVAPPPF